MTASMELPVQLKIARNLEVGDYVRVIHKDAPLTEAPDLFRRVEHIRFAADVAPDSSNIVTYVWCHGVSPCLAFPEGDVEVWVNVPDDRRESDEEARWWGDLDPVALSPGLPPLRETWYREA
jgi:hypothetical protein